MNIYPLMNTVAEFLIKLYNSINAFLQRNIKSCPPKVKEICYKIMARPIVEYACTVWASYTYKKEHSIKVLRQ